MQYARKEAELVRRLCVHDGLAEFVTEVFGWAQGPLPAALIASVGLPTGDEGFCMVRPTRPFVSPSRSALFGVAVGAVGDEARGGWVLGPPAPRRGGQGVGHGRQAALARAGTSCGPDRPTRRLPWDVTAVLPCSRAQVARIVAELHAVGVIHADLKPANFLVSDSTWHLVKISDFGMSDERMMLESTLGASSLRRTEGTKGTPLYCAPEMLVPDDDNDDVMKASRSTDMYSFGIIAHEVRALLSPLQYRVQAAPRFEV